MGNILYQQNQTIPTHTYQSSSSSNFQPNSTSNRSFKRRKNEIEFDAAYEGLSDQERSFFQALKEWRSQTATAQGFAVYQVATNLGLFDIVKKQPKSLEELKQLNGWGHARLKSFGNMILQVSHDFLRSQSSSKFPVFLRHSLVSRIDQTILDLIMYLNSARFEDDQNRLNSLKNADTSLNFLRILIRISFTRKLISIGALENLTIKINEIGKMLHGWIKGTQNKMA